jgi:hypothetical protein
VFQFIPERSVRIHTWEISPLPVFRLHRKRNCVFSVVPRSALGSQSYGDTASVQTDVQSTAFNLAYLLFVSVGDII